MLAVTVALSTLSESTALSGQPATTPTEAENFLALLTASVGAGNESWPDNDPAANSGDTSANPAPAAKPAVTPTPTATVFVHPSQHLTQHLTAPQQQSQNTQAPAQHTTNNNNDQQSAPAPQAPAQKNTSPATNNNNQTDGSTNNTSQSQTTTANAANDDNTAQTAQQLRSQLQNELDAISQILMGMIQAISAAPTTQQPVTTATAATGNNSAVDATNGNSQNSASPSDQEVSLLKDMQSLLGQLQQSLSGQGQENPRDIQKLSDALMADMAKLAQLTNQQASTTGSDDTTATANTQPFSDISSLLKNSIAQAKNQLQTLQNSNTTIYSQLQASWQPPVVDTAVTPKTFSANDNKNPASAAANILAATTPTAPTVQNVVMQPNVDTTTFVAPSSVQPVVSQDGGNSTGNSNQDSGQNTQAQSVTGAGASASTAQPSVANSFSKILTQVSQSNVLEQVRFQVKTALSDGSSKITIQLNPPELGKVDVKLTIDADGKTSGVAITADNKSTLDLLQRDMQGLTRALTDAGLTTDGGSLSFNLSGGQQNQGNLNQQAASTSYQQAQPAEDDPTTAAITRSYVVNLAEGLDITI